MIVDLHTHSNVSDGALPPAELVRLAHANGVTLMSLTDHDTMDGIHAAHREADALGMGFIPGVEVSSRWGGRTIHIVGLGLDSENAGVDEFFRDVCLKRDRRGRLIAEKFDAMGIHGAYEGALALAGNKDNLSRTHFANWLHENGHVETYQDAFDKYLKAGRPCCVEVDWPEVAEAVRFIRDQNGIAVLAHPGRYRFTEDWMIGALMEDFKKAGGEAIEVCSGSQTADDDVRFAQAAREMDFLASTGSDWHSLRSSRPTPGTQPQLPKDLKPVWQYLRW